MNTTRTASLSATLALMAGIQACSPTLNWRNTVVDEAHLHASMPCKPESAVRPVKMPGMSADLSMMACEAGGLRFALGWMRVANADAALLQAWQQASVLTIAGTIKPGQQGTPAWTWTVPGAMRTDAVEAHGRGPRGEPLMMRAVYFVKGDIAFQAAVYGEKPDRTEVLPFFEALRLR